MNWTKTPPTRPGAYWWRLNKKDKEPCLVIEEHSADWDGELIDVSSDRPPNEVGGEWCGPLVPVEEVEKAYEEGRDFLHNPLAQWENSRARRVVEGKEI